MRQDDWQPHPERHLDAAREGFEMGSDPNLDCAVTNPGPGRALLIGVVMLVLQTAALTGLASVPQGWAEPLAAFGLLVVVLGFPFGGAVFLPHPERWPWLVLLWLGLSFGLSLALYWAHAPGAGPGVSGVVMALAAVIWALGCALAWLVLPDEARRRRDAALALRAPPDRQPWPDRQP